MKKLGKFLVVGAVAAVACVGMVACGSYSADYEGEHTYANEWAPESDGYGVKVTVTIEDIEETIEIENPITEETMTLKSIVDGKITKITVEDPEGYHNITATWTENANPGDLGHDKTVEQLPDYLKRYEGALLSEVCAIEVDKGEKWTISNNDYVLTGATQTSGRIILAIQDACQDWAKHVMEENMQRLADELGVDIEDLLQQSGGSIQG